MFKILTDDTLKVIHRSNIRSALDPNSRNLCIDPLNETFPEIIKSVRAVSPSSDHGEDLPSPTSSDPVPSMFVIDPQALTEPNATVPTSQVSPFPSEESTPTPSPVISPQDLVGRTFLMDERSDGQHFRARIVECINDHEEATQQTSEHVKFRCSINEDDYEEIITYNELMDFLQKNVENDAILWKYKHIIGHQGPLTPADPSYMGSRFNVQLEWENGEITYEPLRMISADDPVTCAIYARDKGLLDEPGWKQFKCLALQERQLIRQVNQSKLHSYHTAPRYKFGYPIPRDYAEAIRFDIKNGNTRWQDATKLEMQQLDDYHCFEDAGIAKDRTPPEGYKKIRVHLVFDVKHDGRHKSHCVAGGHLTDVPIDSVYSGVISLRGLHLVAFLSELNDLELWATDIGNAYLEAYTGEKVYIIAGPEFGDREGHILIIWKALYGLRSSGLRWYETFSACLRDMGFFPSKAEPEIWMHRVDDHYEYIAVYVDDLAIASKDPQSIINVLTKAHGFKLKGTGPIDYHLGMTFRRNDRGTLCISPKRYIDKMVGTYQQLFGTKPSTKALSPLEKGDHPEIDDSDFLDEADTQVYQSLIGALQWAISIGRLDICTAVMTMSSFHAQPRKGHLERVKCIYGYLYKMRDAEIPIRTQEPDFSEVPNEEYDWCKTVYGDVHEVIPKDIPEPLGRFVTTVHYVDANLYHCMLTGRSVMGILHFVNQMPIDWYSKKQATVETATYGSEFVAARTCVDQVVDLRLTLRYLGVPVRERSYMFGDNKSVVDSSTKPHAKLHKWHNALSFHHVREAIASKFINFSFIDGQFNPADVLSKHWGYQQVWVLLKPILFFSGNTNELFEDD